MKSGSSGRRSPDDDADEVFDSRPEPPRSPAKGESSAAEFDEFDEEDFDDEELFESRDAPSARVHPPPSAREELERRLAEARARRRTSGDVEEPLA